MSTYLQSWPYINSSDYKSQIGFQDFNINLREFSEGNNFVINIWFIQPEIMLRDFNENSSNKINIGFSNFNLNLNPNLLKDDTINFEIWFKIRFWIGTTKSQFWFTNILICWQDNAFIWTDSFNCRFYYPEKEGKGFVWNKLLNLTIPFNEIWNFKINYSFLSNTENKICFKNSSKCFKFDFLNNSMQEDSSILNGLVIKSNSTYFNNSLAYIKDNNKLNLSDKIELLNNPEKVYLFWAWNLLLLQQDNKLSIYNSNYDLISSINNIEIKDIIKTDDKLYLVNNLNKNKLYEINSNGELDFIELDKNVDSKLYWFKEWDHDWVIYFASGKDVYRYEVKSKKLYKKTDMILNWENEDVYLFPIDRWNLKKEFILFN